MDYWWGLGPKENPDDVFEDILEKINNYGIPFLENSVLTQEDWFS